MENTQSHKAITLADIPFVKKKGEIDREKLRAEFKGLFELDPLLPALLAGRSALRIMPLLLPADLFDAHVTKDRQNGDSPSEKTETEKTETEKNDTEITPEKTQSFANKVIHYYAAHMVYWQLLTNQSQKPAKERDLDKIKSAANAAADAAKAAKAAKASKAAYAAAYAAKAAKASKAAYAAYAAADAATNTTARFGGKKLQHKVLICLYQDMHSVSGDSELKEKVERLHNQPLWWVEMPELLALRWREEFKPQLEQIAKDSNLKRAQEAAEKICEDYEGLLKDSEPEQISKASTYIPSETERERIDTLNRGNLVNGLAQILKDEQSDHHLTVGLLGRWGMGKSRVLDLLREQLKSGNSTSQQPFLFGEFNAWSYEYCDNIQAAMTQEVFSALAAFPEPYIPKEQKADSWLGWISQRVKRVSKVVVNGVKRLGFNVIIRTILAIRFDIKKSSFRVIFMLLWLLGILYLLGRFHTDFIMRPDVWKEIKDNYLPFAAGATAFLLAIKKLLKETRTFFAQPYTKELLTYVKLPDYAKHLGQIAQMQQDIKYLCDLRLGSNESDKAGYLGSLLTRKKRLLFVVDDLDRCQPQGIVKTLEAIRLVLDIPQVKVIIAVDQRIALAALAKHYEDIKEHHELNSAKAIARDYLGKMIHLPVQLPDADNSSLRGYLSHLWSEDEEEAAQVDKLFMEYGLASDKTGNDLTEQAKSEVETSASDKMEKEDGNQVDEQNNNEASSVASKDPVPETSKSNGEFDAIEYLLSDSESITDEPEVEPTTVSMTPQQKVAFRFWLETFSLNNPRQVKRLHNSYNLLRLVLKDEDKPLEKSESDDGLYCAVSNGLMIALLIQEFVNTQDDNNIRVFYQNWLETGNLDKDAFADLKDAHSQDNDMFERALALVTLCGKRRFGNSLDDDARNTLIELCKLYVLPAINVEDEKPAS